MIACFENFLVLQVPRHHFQEYLILHLKFQRPSSIICTTFLFVLSFLHPLSNYPHFIGSHLYHFLSQQFPFTHFNPIDKGMTFSPIHRFIWDRTNSSLITIIVHEFYQWLNILLVSFEFYYTCPKKIFKCLDGPFKLTIYLRMKCSTRVHFSSESLL